MLRRLSQKVTLVALLFLGLFVVMAVVAIANILGIRDAAAHLGTNTVAQVS